MGTHHGGNGGNIPPDGDRSPDDPLDLPELPPEWGHITIPDDASELAAEAEKVRRELAEQRTNPRRSGTPTAKGQNGQEPSIGVPLLIMSVAVMITLVSLFAMAWSGSSTTRGTAGDGAAVEELPRVFLTDALGQQVPIAGYSPMVIMLIEACESCDDLVVETVAAAPPGVTVLAVGGNVTPARPPNLETNGAALRPLSDPDGLLRTELALGPPTNAATVVLVDQNLRITHIVPSATTIGQFHAALDDLA